MQEEDVQVQDHITEEENRLKKRSDLEAKGIETYAYEFNKTHQNQEIINKYSSIENEDTNEDTVSIAGRLIAKRGHGKAIFGNLLDESAPLQFYANVNQVGEELFELITHLDLGDIIGVTGTPFKTKRGELSIRVKTLKLLTKSLAPLPEKFHGLQDKELRYRKRYMDLIANPEARHTFKTRSKIIRSIREYLDEEGFMEVETPILHNIYGGAAARPFETFHNELDQSLYLRIALELHQKRIIVGGFEKIYEIGRVFRNEGVSYKHNPEFTMIELYQAYADYSDIMTLTEELLRNLVQSVHQSDSFTYQGQNISFKEPFKRITLSDAIKEYGGVDISDEDALRKKATELGIEVKADTTKGQLINDVYEKTVEHHLIQPTFITDYPWETSPLAKRKRDNNDLVERFELIVNGMELANAFTELNDPIDQKMRFEDQLKAKEAGLEDAHMMDLDYIEALKVGLPPTGGLGIGIDRVVMLLTDSASIRDVLLFPHMRSV